MRITRIVLAVVSLVLLSACGSSDAPEPATQDPAASVEPDQLYSCGGTGFDPAKLEGPGDLEDSDSELGEALRTLFEAPEGDFLAEADGWRIVHEKENEAVLAAPTGSNEHPFLSATFKREGSDWEAAGWGECLPTAFGDRSVALWELEETPDPDATELRISVSEQACASGRTLKPEEIQTEVEYSADSVTILATADPLPKGAHTCQGNPSTTITVELDEPIGDRKLLDAGSYPPS